jgi:hypothetical protein
MKFLSKFIQELRFLQTDRFYALILLALVVGGAFIYGG